MRCAHVGRSCGAGAQAETPAAAREAVRMLGGVAVAGAQAKTPATVRGQR